jgi:hypothetical protein
MAGLVPAIHVLAPKKDLDARHEAGHDERESTQEALVQSPINPS